MYNLNMDINRLKNIRAILFDLDGTLVSDEDIQVETMLKTINFFNIDMSIQEFSKRFSGKGLFQIEEDLIREFNLKIKQGDIRKKRKEIVIELLSKRKTCCTYFAKELVQFLNKRYPLAICSAGEKEEVLLKLKNNNLLKYFKKIICAEDVERSKPYPDIYIKGAKELGFIPKECLAFEDSIMGLTAAKSAGTVCFVVPDKKLKQQDFFLADRILESLEEAYNIFKNI
jgi:beta-phosphoglucomutase-like phosphatase (HAD superfamily)